MKRSSWIWTVGLIWAAVTGAAQAQGPYESRQLMSLRGTKVRLHTHGGRHQGIMVGVADGMVLLRRSSWQTDELPVDGILRVEVYSRDRDGTLTGMMLGGALGAGFGLGLAEWLDSLDDEAGVGHGGRALMTSLGALLGATLGAHAMGANWTALPAPAEVGFDLERGLTLSLAQRF